MLAILGGMSDFLSSVSNQPGGYSEEQRRGCIACALRLGKPELVNVLAKLHSLAASCWAHSSSDAAALKALAVLLGVPANKDPLEDAIAWRLARPTPRPPEVWKKEHRQTALALLLKAPPNSDSEADLVLKLLKSVASWATAALCVLLAAPAGTSLDEAKQGAVVTLAEHVASGKVGKGKTYPGLEICALLLGCDAKEAAILSQASSVPWAKAAQSAIKTVAGLESAPAKPAESPSSAQQVSPAPPLDLSKVKALLKESHERQMLGLVSMLQPKREQDEGREAGLVRSMVGKVKSLPGEAVLIALRIILGLPPGHESSSLPVELLQCICHGPPQLPTADLRLAALACALQVPEKLEAVLQKTTSTQSGKTAGSMSKELQLDIVQCVLLQQAVPQGQARAQASLLAALQRKEISAEVRQAVEALLPKPPAPTPRRPETPPAKKQKVEPPIRPKEKEEVKEAKDVKDTKDVKDVKDVKETKETKDTKEAKDTKDVKPEEKDEEKPATPVAKKAETGVPKEKKEEPVKEKTEPAKEKAKVEESVSGKAPPKKPAAPAQEPQEEKKEEAEESDADGWNALKALVEEEDDEEDEDEEDQDAENENKDEAEDMDDDEEGEEEESVEGYDLIGGFSDSDEGAGSYGGSDLDALHFSDSEGSVEFSDEGEGTIKGAGGGLLTAMFGGGSLHSEEKAKDKGRKAMVVEYPNMIWKGEDICVVQKPADWICSASDVDKKKGRKLDPNEDLRNKGFKVMKDLLDYKFAEREKKYIHWWIQLMHETNREEFPNLFDVDQNYGLCHRLDRETSGTVLVGITKKSRTQMRECFHRHYVRKLYVCLVHGFIDKAEQTVDRNLEAMGQKAKLDRRGKRARTHVKVLGYFTRTHKSGRVDQFTLCTCEIAEGRMHQIRLHMAAALGSPIVSEFYYQKAKQMIEDRRWCQRVFLHAYAVGFPDMGATNDDDEEEEGNCEEDDEEKLRVEDTEQEWHCCICPLTNELRKVLKDLKPTKGQLKGIQAETMLQSCLDSGLINPNHKEVHCKGTVQRGQLIDEIYFPWSSKVNPIAVGDLAKVRADASQRQKQQAMILQQQEERLEKQKNERPGRSFSREAHRENGPGPLVLRPKAKARGRCSVSPRRKRGVSVGNKRSRLGRRLRSPGAVPPRDRSAEPSLSPSDTVNNPVPPRQVRRVRSRSGRVVRRRSQSIRRRLPGPPPPAPSPGRRSSSVLRRRGKRRKPDGLSPEKGGRSPQKRGLRSQLGARRRGGTLSQG